MVQQSKSWDITISPHKTFCSTSLSFIIVHTDSMGFIQVAFAYLEKLCLLEATYSNLCKLGFGDLLETQFLHSGKLWGYRTFQ